MAEPPGASTVCSAGTPVARASSPYRWLALGAGMLAFSTASILTRLVDAPPLVVGAWRMGLATILLTPWALPRFLRERKALSRRDLVMVILAGTALALHFATWISSLYLTTVASSVILVTTNPIWVGLASHFVLRKRVKGRQVLAIAIAMVGSVIVSYGDLGLSGRALVGDLLALVGAVMASAYFLLGSSIRRKVSTLAYVWPCYGLAALLLVASSALGGQPLTGYGVRTYLVLLLLALGPQILGHSSFNWALAQFSPLMVALAILGEPIGASILAILVLGELPPLSAPFGGLLILAGIYVASREEMKTNKENVDEHQLE